MDPWKQKSASKVCQPDVLEICSLLSGVCADDESIYSLFAMGIQCFWQHCGSILAA